jgi:DNA-binding MarR family transcriptional regulator
VAAGLVGGEPGLSVQALAERLDRSHSATVRVVDRLEDAGLVERSRSRADARRATLSLTAAGRERLADGTRAADESIDVLLQDLTSGERVLLDRIMAKVAQRLPGDRTAGARVCRFCDPTGCGARGCPRERSD